MCIEGTGVALAAVTSWYAIMNHCVLELLCGTIDTNTTESCVDDLRRAGTFEQMTLTTAAGVGGDHFRTLSKLH